jgi:hypothetical protein
VRIVDIQYFKGAKIKTLSAMHDLRAMSEKTLEYAIEMFENDTDVNSNSQPSLGDFQLLIITN